MLAAPPPLFAEGLRSHVGPWNQNLTRLLGGAASSAVWPAANRALFLPWHVLVPTTIRRVWLLVGATGGTNSVDIGLYDPAGNRIVSSGGTTVGTANQIQYIDITDTLVMPGAYYLGIAMNGTTATALVSSTGTEIARSQLAGLLQMATAYVLPATATMVAVTSNYNPFCGFATTASP